MSVKDDGIVELAIPELSRGQIVAVAVQLIGDVTDLGGVLSSADERPLGLLKGRIVMRDDFDLPMSEFDDFT